MGARGRAARWLAPAVCALLAFLAFLPALRAGFVDLDDEYMLAELEREPGLGWMATTRALGHWQPLTWLSWTLDRRLHGEHAAGWHLTSLLLHALVAALFCVLARELLRRARPEAAARSPLGLELTALLASLGFALHPLRAESVVWITERRDLLSAVLLLAAVLAWLPAREGARRSPVPALVLHALSLLAKAWGMVLAPVLLVLDVFPLRRWNGGAARARLVEKLPFLALGLASAAIASWSIHYALGTVRSWSEWTLSDRVAQAGYGLWFYAARTLWPAGLSPMVELPATLDPFSGRMLVVWAVLGAALATILVLRRRAPALAAAAAVYVIFLAPVLGFMQAGPQLVADRYSYLACMGWPIALAAGGWKLWERAAWRAPLACAAVLLPLALGLASWRQAQHWRSSETLWAHAVEAGPPSAIAERGLARALAARGEVEGALAHLERAVAIDPASSDAWFALGKVREKRGEHVLAAQAYARAAEHGQPAYLSWMALGRLQRDVLGDRAAALASFAAAVASVEASPPELFNPNPYLALGLELARAGRKAEARRALEVAARYERTAGEARRALEALGQGD